jgi:m7GpppX diphosphatase
MTVETKKRPSEEISSSSDSKRTKESSSTTGSVTAEEASSTSRVTPLSILSDDSCKVQTLTVSDQHATLLLTHDASDKKASPLDKDSTATSDPSTDTDADADAEEQPTKPIQSLLKLTVVPFHKEILGSNPVYSPSDTQKPELKLLDHNPTASAAIAAFLQNYGFQLKSESGAEYSYYNATPSSIPSSADAATTSTNMETDTKEDVSTPVQVPSNSHGAFDVELISPATERQIYRAMPSLGSVLIHETPDLYNQVVQPYIQSIVDGNSLGWINNVIEVKKEKERLIVNSSEFIVNIDTKWRSHPPPLSTPREEWHGHSSVADLYCLGIVKQKGIASLRDLRGEHISLLKNLQREGLEAIQKIYGVESDQIRCFVHYQPQFYHFHVHFTRLENEIGSTVERGHLLSDIIQNLEMDDLYYQKRTITYKVKKLSPLHNLIASFSKETK